MPIDPFRQIQDATRTHLRQHGCGAYTFEDGVGLTELCRKYQPLQILELGTALGYTACCMALGSAGSHIDTIERDPVHANLARENIESANLSGQIIVLVGDFCDILPTLSSVYDFAFFDGFAPEIAILNALERLLTPGGILACANLGLVEPVQKRRLTSKFSKSHAWQPLQMLEHGSTAVWQKRSV